MSVTRLRLECPSSVPLLPVDGSSTRKEAPPTQTEGMLRGAEGHQPQQGPARSGCLLSVCVNARNTVTHGANSVAVLCDLRVSGPKQASLALKLSRRVLMPGPRGPICS